MAAAILVAMSEASSEAAMLAVTSIGASAVFNVNDSVPAPVAAPVTEKVSVDGANATAYPASVEPSAVLICDTVPICTGSSLLSIADLI